MIIGSFKVILMETNPFDTSVLILIDSKWGCGLSCSILLLSYPWSLPFFFWVLKVKFQTSYTYVLLQNFTVSYKVPAEAVWYPGTWDSDGGKQLCECWGQKSSARVAIALNCWGSFLAPTPILNCLPMQIHSQSITCIQRVICLKNIVSSKLALSHIWYSPVQTSE